MPDCYETMSTIAPEYTILALSGDGEPSLACATYGKGRICVIMDAPVHANDICGDSPALSQTIVSRMLDWSKRSKSVDLPVLEIVNRPLLQFLQNHPNIFPFLQNLLQQLGL